MPDPFSTECIRDIFVTNWLEMSEQDYIDHLDKEQKIYKQSRNPALPPFLRLPTEKIREDQFRQDKLRELHSPHIKQTAAEQKYARALIYEKVIRENLKHIDKEAQPKVYAETKMQLAEALADQGEFQKAAEIAVEYGDTDTLDHYQNLAAAVEADDDEVCECPEDSLRGTDIPNRFVAGEVYSKKHGKIVPVVACGKCGYVNVREAPAPRDLSNVEKR
jgi:hypothetical protein